MFIINKISGIAYGFGALILYALLCLFIKPIRIILKIALCGLFGTLLLFIVNIMGNFSGISIAINPFTAIIVGIMGIPGIFLVIVSNLLF
ncbi:MAG: pro-sigmaK processing inhibitor BofA family protein [Clostridiales bacterium]|nr:pro-sigmaK processing inhibitor BofA family protein [Clostridiales bacterium]